MQNPNLITTINRWVRALLQDRLRTTGRDVFIYDGIPNFTLSEDYPSSSTILVYKNGILLSSGWSYNSATKIVTISASLTTGDTILILYSFYSKYSDNEINDYIESSLIFFNQFGYKKLFRVSDDGTKIVTVNGINPTLKECYEISIIAAIHTDPQNIDIKTKDFSVTAHEKENKSDLIAKALSQFTTWYGNMDFTEDLLEI